MIFSYFQLQMYEINLNILIFLVFHHYRGVEQEVVASAPVILPHGGEHVVDVEVGLLHLDVTLCPVSYTHLDR